MSITLRLRNVAPPDAVALHETLESALTGDWIVTVSQSHVDGQWHVLLDDGAGAYRAVVASPGQLQASAVQELLRARHAADAETEVAVAVRRTGRR